MNTAAAHGRPVGNSGEMAIELRAVSKQYALFDRPADRLKQMLLGGVSRLGARSSGYVQDSCATIEINGACDLVPQARKR